MEQKKTLKNKILTGLAIGAVGIVLIGAGFGVCKLVDNKKFKDKGTEYEETLKKKQSEIEHYQGVIAELESQLNDLEQQLGISNDVDKDSGNDGKSIVIESNERIK